MTSETTPPKVAEATEKKAPKAKKSAEPEKPFAELITQDLIPATITALQKRGVITPILKLDGNVLLGSFNEGEHSFEIVFTEGTLESTKFFRSSSEGIPVSTVESFMIDERKAGVDLVVFYIVQRLTAQQWF